MKSFRSSFPLIAGLLLLSTACKKSTFTDINTDPTSVDSSRIDPNYLLTTAMINYTGSNDQGSEVQGTEIFGAGCFIQHFTSVLQPDIYGDKYLLALPSWGSLFNHIYTNDIKFVVDLYQLTSNKPAYANMHQISRILKALIFQKLTDTYGDVPYSQAALGYYQNILNPVYDRQQAIYADMMKEVEEATDSLDLNGDKPTGDIFYSSAADQIGSWKKFGSSLLLRLAMRLTKVDAATAQAYVTKLAGKTFTTNDDNAVIHFDGSGSSLTYNRVTEAIANNSTYRQFLFLSEAFVDSLKATDDPRLPVLSQEADSTKGQNGLPPGFDQTSAATGIANAPGYLGDLSFYAQPSVNVIGDKDRAAIDYGKPAFILTYAQSELLLADAAARWGIGDAETHYHNGVVAAMTELSEYGSGVAEADAEAWYTAHPYDAAHGLAQINTQYWIETFLNEIEAWSNWRRTGFPELTPTNYHGNVTGGTIPRRMAYPQSEALANGANYQAAVQASLPQGDNLTSRVWWDVK